MPRKITLDSAIRDIALELIAQEDGTCEDKIKSRDTIWRRGRQIYERFVDIRTQVANNEQNPYAESEIGIPTTRMQTKKETGYRQTADYVVYWKYKHENEKAYRKMGICFERKTEEDFHGTIIHGYSRFDKEIERFVEDDNTLIMMILVECTRAEALSHLPPKRYSGAAVRNMFAAKIGAISSIEMRGVHVCFQGSRRSAANSIKSYVAHFFEKNIAFVLRDELESVMKEIRKNELQMAH